MNILLAHIKTNSGNDVFFSRLETALSSIGVKCNLLSMQYNVIIFRQKMAKELMQAIEVVQPDLIITHAELASLAPANLPPIIAIAHHRPGSPKLLPYLKPAQRLYYKYHLDGLFRRGVNRAEKVAAVSKFTADETRPLMAGKKVNQLSVILNGIDTDFFSPAKKIKPKKEAHNLLFVGNPSPRKGFDLLPQTMHILGKGYQLRYTSGLRKKKIPFQKFAASYALGHLSTIELREELRSCDALLFPSRLEGFGYAAIEAMSCGKPVIGVDCGPMPEIMPPELKLHMAQTHSPEALASSTLSIFRQAIPPEALRNWAVKHFSLNRMAQEYLHLASRLLNQHK